MSSLSTVLYSYFLILFNCAILQEFYSVEVSAEVLSKRLASYRSMTEPLIHYYSERRKLLTVDGMMTIEHVTREINRILAAIGAVEEAKAFKKAATKRAAGGAKSAPKPVARKASKSRR